jgi:CHAT domain-containing protein
LRAQGSNHSISKHDAKLSLIAVAKTQNDELPTLWNVKQEVGYVRSTAEEAGVSIEDSCMGRGTFINGVSESFQRANMAHIACHGIQDAESALSSGFCLVDGRLTVHHLMELDLKNAFFAFLSACETAKGDKDQPDQIVHLAAAMLFIGFRSIVATMW